MTNLTHLPVRPGDTVHAVRAVTLILRMGEGLFDSDSVLIERGQTFTVTQSMLDAARDREGGFGIFQTAGQPGAVLGLGPWPEGEQPWVHGDTAWAEARERARQAAHRLYDPDERTAALAEVRRIYGSQPTSRTLSQNAESGRAADNARLRGIINVGGRR